jgi:diguanylate cyclase (GGDEF)-like protein/PAS domain S-box-containing protein
MTELLLIAAADRGAPEAPSPGDAIPFEDVFECAAIGMALLSPAGQWLRVNTAVCDLVGYSAAELLKMTFQDITHPDDLAGDLALVGQMLDGTIRTFQLEKRYLHRAGHVVWGLLSVSLVRDALGRPRYFISQIQDITERKRIEQALRESELRFRTLFEHSPDGVLLVDPYHPSGLWPIVDCNTAACTMNGYTRNELLNQPIDLINAKTDTAEGRAAYLARLRQEGQFRNETMHRRKDGSLVPIMTSTCLITLDGRELVLGIDRDMTALTQAEAALHTANRQLAAQLAELAEHMHATQLIADLGVRLHGCQRTDDAADAIAQALDGAEALPAGTLVVRDDTSETSLILRSWGSPPPQPPASALACALLDTRAERSTACTRCRAGVASCVPFVALGTTLGVLQLHAPADSLSDLQQRMVTTIADRSAIALANIQLRQSLHRQAIHDPLTNLFNRRHMEEALTRELHRAGRRGWGVGVLLIDIDHFKALNDTYGHLAGDAVLRCVANYLRSHIRSHDSACRYGGEEFLLILTEVTPESLAACAMSLRAGLRQLAIVHDDRALGPITVSIGAALFPAHGHTAESMIAAADSALYRAKQAGRDRIIVAGLEAPLDSPPGGR